MGLLKAFICAILTIGAVFGMIWLGDTYPDVAAILLGSVVMVIIIIVLTVIFWYNFFSK